MLSPAAVRPPSSRGSASPTPSDTSSRPARPPKSARRRRPKSGAAAMAAAGAAPTSLAMDRELSSKSSGCETCESETTTEGGGSSRRRELSAAKEREMGFRAAAMEKLEGIGSGPSRSTSMRMSTSFSRSSGFSTFVDVPEEVSQDGAIAAHLRELAKGKRRRSRAQGSKDLWGSAGSRASIATFASILTAGGESVYEDAMEEWEDVEDEAGNGMVRRKSVASLRSKKSKQSLVATPDDADSPPTPVPIPVPPLASTSAWTNPFSNNSPTTPFVVTPPTVHEPPRAGPSRTSFSSDDPSPSTVIPLRRYSAIPSRPGALLPVANRRNSTQSHPYGQEGTPRAWHPKPLVLTPARTAFIPLTSSSASPISPGARRSSSAMGNYAAASSAGGGGGDGGGASRRSSMNVSMRDSVSGRSSPLSPGFGPGRRRSMGYVEPGAVTAKNRDSVTSSVGYSYRSQGLGRKRSESEDTGLTRMSGESPDSSLSGWSEGENGRSIDGSPKEREWDDRRRSMRPSSLEAVQEGSPMEKQEELTQKSLVGSFHVQTIDHAGPAMEGEHRSVSVKKDSPPAINLASRPSPRLVASPPSDPHNQDSFEPPSPPPTFPLPGIPTGPDDEPTPLLHPNAHLVSEAGYSEDNESGNWSSEQDRRGSSSTDNEDWHSNPTSPPLITEEMTSNGEAGAVFIAGASAQARRSSLSPRTPAFTSAPTTPVTPQPAIPVFRSPLITPPTPGPSHALPPDEEPPPAIPPMPISIAPSPTIAGSPVSNKSPIIIKGRNKSEGAMRKRPSRDSTMIRRSVSGNAIASRPSSVAPVVATAPTHAPAPAPHGSLSGLALWPAEAEPDRPRLQQQQQPQHRYSQQPQKSLDPPARIKSEVRNQVAFATPLEGAPTFQSKAPRLGEVSSPQGTRRRPISTGDGTRLEARDPRTQIDRPDPVMRDLLNSTPPFNIASVSEYSDDESTPSKRGSARVPGTARASTPLTNASPKKSGGGGGAFKSLLSSFRNGSKRSSENVGARTRAPSPLSHVRPGSRHSSRSSQASQASAPSFQAMPMFSPPPPLAVFSLVEEGYMSEAPVEPEPEPRHSTSSSISERRAPPRPFQLPPGLGGAGMKLPPGLSADDRQPALQPQQAPNGRVRMAPEPSPSLSAHSSRPTMSTHSSSYHSTGQQSSGQRSQAYPSSPARSPISASFNIPSRNSSIQNQYQQPQYQQQHPHQPGPQSYPSPGAQEYLDLGAGGATSKKRNVSPRGGRARQETNTRSEPSLRSKSHAAGQSAQRPSYGPYSTHSSSTISSTYSNPSRPIPLDMMSQSGQMAVRDVFKSQFLER